MLDEDCPQRNPIPAWVDQKETIVLDGDDDDEKPNQYIDDTAIPTKQESNPSPQQAAIASDTIIESSKKNENIDSVQKESKEAKREAKKAKKDGKEARKLEREAIREAKKVKKETKKLQKEAKKRKREETGDE